MTTNPKPAPSSDQADPGAGGGELVVRDRTPATTGVPVDVLRPANDWRSVLDQLPPNVGIL